MDYQRGYLENEKRVPLGDLGSIIVDVPTLHIGRIFLVGPDGPRQPFPAGWTLEDAQGKPCFPMDGCFFVHGSQSCNLRKNGELVLRLVHPMQQQLLIPANQTPAGVLCKPAAF